MNVSKINSNLKIKIFAAFALLSLLVSGILLAVSYENLKGRLRDDIRFVVDAEPHPELIAPLVEDDFYTDKFGTQLSGYAPFFDADGQRAGIVGVDISADNIIASERRFLFVALMVFLSMAPLLLLASWFLSRRLSAVAFKATAALRESEKKYRKIVEASRDGYLVCKGNGEIMMANASYAEMLGYSVEELKELNWIEFTPEKWREEELKTQGKSLLERGYTDLYQKEYTHRDGHVFPVEVQAYVLEEKEDFDLSIMGAFVRDITERNLAERYQNLSVEVLSILNEGEAFQVTIRRILDVLKQKTGCDAVGVRLERGEDFPYFLQDGFPTDFLLTENSLMTHDSGGGVCRNADGSVCLECTCGLVLSGKTDPSDPLFTEGGSCWMNNSISLLDLPEADDPRAHPRNECIHHGYASVALIPISAGGKIAGLLQLNGRKKGLFSLSAIQILEGIAKHIGDALQRKEEAAERMRLMAAVEQLGEVVVITDLNAKIEYVNPAFETVTGYTSEEAIGQNISILESGEHDGAFYNAMWETLRRGEAWSGQFINKKKDGEFYTEDATISPVFDATGQTVNYVAVKRDVTQELNLEEQFRQAQKMQSIGQLVAGIAHDFNNLMQVINGYADIARKRLPSDHEVGENIDQIRKAGDQAKNLVKQLLAFSRQQVIDPVDLDLNEVIKNSWKMLRHMIGEHIHFEFNAGEKLGTVFADRGQIEQVLMNLCVNARDAMPNGGMLTVQTEEMAISPDDLKTHAWAQPGDYILLSVRDTGCGMNEKTLKLVFEPFFTTKEVGEGAGLGLSTVYGILKQSEGNIDAESEPGEGATFRIYLPVSKPLLEETVDAISESGAFVDGGIETLLVAEDEEVVLKLATQILSEAGYTVLAAKDGEEAVQVFEEHADEIDCVMMDVLMPRMSGKDAIEKMLQKRPSLRHLFVTGYSPYAGHADFIKETGEHLLGKPYNPDALLQKIRSVLDED